MSEWKPISSAPKDGTHILVTDNRYFGFGYINGVAAHWSAVVHWWSNPGEEGWYLSSGNCDDQMDVTHWMPLPDPPHTETKP